MKQSHHSRRVGSVGKRARSPAKSRSAASAALARGRILGNHRLARWLQAKLDSSPSVNAQESGMDRRPLAHEPTLAVPQRQALVDTIQRSPEILGWRVSFEPVPQCPPAARLLGSYSDEDIADELYADPGYLLTWSGDEPDKLLIDYDALRPMWQPYFAESIPLPCPSVPAVPPAPTPVPPPEFEPVSEAILGQATATPWPAHQAVYVRWQEEGRDFGIAGLAPTWEGFLAQMHEMDFMGHRVVGHEAFLTRLNQAQAHLRSQYPSIPESQLVRGVGTPGMRSQWRAGERGTSYHVFGLAVDVDAGRNPWIANPQYAARRARYHWTIWRAAWLIGGVEPIWPARSQAWAESLTTEQLWQRFHDTSAAVHDYFALLDNEEQLRTRVSALGPQPEAPPYDYAPGEFPVEALSAPEPLEAWRGAIAADQEAWPGHPEYGFMNLRLELVQAMRDVAGLAWGAADLGPRESGDFMHFDLRTPQFEQFRNQVRAQLAASE